MFLGGTGDADQKVYTVAVQQKRLAGLGGYTVVEALEQLYAISCRQAGAA